MKTITFVGGFLRTGTSLLQSILCQGRDTNPMIGEVIYLRGLVETYARCLYMFDQHARFYFDDDRHLGEFCGNQVRQLLDLTRQRYGNPAHLILKHPQLTPNFPLLSELLPEARFVVILRDPRDAVASAVRAGRKGAAEFAGSSPTRIAADYLSYYQRCFEGPNADFHQKTLYVKYEHLVRDPLSVTSELQAFLGIDLGGFHPLKETADEDWLRTGSQSSGQPFHSPHYGKAVTESRVGQYADALNKRDIRKIETDCRMLLDILEVPSPTFTVDPP